VEILSIPGGKFRKTGLGKDVTDKFLSGLPHSKRRLRRIITSALYSASRIQIHPYRVFEFFGQVRDAVPASLRSRLFNKANVRTTSACWPSGTSGRALLKGSGYATKASVSGAQMVLIADVVSDRRMPPRTTPRNCALAICARAKVLLRSLPKRVKILAGSRAHCGYRKTRQCIQDQRGCGYSVTRMGDYCDGIERINIELPAQQNTTAGCAG